MIAWPSELPTMYAAERAGRWGGRASDKAGVRDAEDIDPERIWALYTHNRPGTPGEKAAAAAALRRMGIDPEARNPSRPEPRPEPPRQKPQPAAGPKRFRVTLRYEWKGRTLYWGPEEIEARDEIDAEAKLRKRAQES